MAAAGGPSGGGAGQEAEDVYDRGCDLAEAGQHDVAVELFTRAGELGHRDAWLALGNSLRELDRPEKAVEAFRRAVAVGDDLAPLNLGAALEVVEDWDGAEAAYQRARAVGDPRATMFLAHLWRWHGDATAARELLRRSAAAGDAHAAGDLGVWMHQDAGEPTRASAEVEALLRQGSGVHDDARSDLAWILRARGDLDEAEVLLRAGVDAGHTDSGIRLGLLLEEDRSDLAGAEAVLRRAAADGELFAWNNLGRVLERLGRLLEAEAALQRGARGGDVMAARNLRRLRTTHRRHLNRAHRVTARRPDGPARR